LPDKLKLSLAIDRYDRHMPFFDGTLDLPDRLELDVKQAGQSNTLRDGTDRHGRMIHDGEFDICEFSMSTFLMAKSRGMPLAGIPVFPRRLFSQSQMWVHPDSGIWHPKDLIGKKVAVSSFQTTLSLLAKGDLKFYYDVPWEEIHWLLTSSEKVKFEPKAGVKIDYIGDQAGLGHKLVSGEVDALFLPRPPKSVAAGETPARHLFKDCRAEEKEYFDTVGDFPIMHVVAVRQSLIEEEPWLAQAIIDMFNQARDISERYYDDPGYTRMAWARHGVEEERHAFGNPWQNGFKQNRANLERFIKYSHDQGLIDEVYPPEILFVESTLDT
jgi:4,5-dihydroxyphthalate decarboxylase